MLSFALLLLLTVSQNGKCSQQSLPLENVYDVRSISLVKDLIWAGCSDGFIRIFDVKVSLYLPCFT